MVKINIIIISLILTLILQNKQGDNIGSIFMKINKKWCLHLHHWILSILFIAIIYYLSCQNNSLLISIGIGVGLAGFLAYSDRFEILVPCTV